MAVNIKPTKRLRLIRRLRNGKNLTEKEAKSNFGITHLSKRIHDLRLEGFVISTNTIRTKDGLVTGYRLEQLKRRSLSL